MAGPTRQPAFIRTAQAKWSCMLVDGIRSAVASHPARRVRDARPSDRASRPRRVAAGGPGDWRQGSAGLAEDRVRQVAILFGSSWSTVAVGAADDLATDGPRASGLPRRRRARRLSSMQAGASHAAVGGTPG